MRGFQPAVMRGKAKPFANGGQVRGPGTGTSDDVPDEVPSGTYIMPTDSTQAMGERQLAVLGAGPRGFSPRGKSAQVPVQLSNGEFKLPPEQVHAIGVQVLDQMKDATHVPTAARGFATGSLKAVAAKTFKGEPPLFFADGGVVRGLPVRRRFSEGGVAGDEHKRPNSFGDAAAAAANSGVTRVASPTPTPESVPVPVSTTPAPEQARVAPSPSNTFPGNRLPGVSGATSAESTSSAPAGMTDAQRAAALAQIPTDTTPAASPLAGAGQQAAPGVFRSGNSYGDSAAVASAAQPRGLPGASAPTEQPAAPAMSQAREVMPGIYRSGNSYSDSPTAAMGDMQTRGLPTPQTAMGGISPVGMNVEQAQRAGLIGERVGYNPAYDQRLSSGAGQPSAQPRGLPSMQNMAAADAMDARGRQDVLNNIQRQQNAAAMHPGGGPIEPGSFTGGFSGVIGTDPAAGRERKAMIDSLTSVIPGARGITRAQRDGMQTLLNREQAAETAAAQRATSLQQTEIQNATQRDVAAMGEFGANQRALLQQSLAETRERNTGVHQANQDDIARKRLALDTVQAGQGSVPAGYRRTANGLEAIPGGPGDKANGPLNDVQSKALQFGTRMLQSGQALDQLSKQGVSQPGYIKRMADVVGAGAMANWTQSPQQQQVEQSQTDYVNAVLRRESGAAISNSEFDNARKQYFPQPGDSGQVIEQKRRNRELATRGVLAEVPDQQNRVQQVLGAAGQGQQRTVVRTGTANGRKVLQYSDGSIGYAD